MIVNFVAGVARKSFRLSQMLALMLLLPLLFALTPTPASARDHSRAYDAYGHSHQTHYAARPRAPRGWTAHWARPHRAWAQAHLHRRPVLIASYARRHHVQHFARVWHRRVHAFAAAQPSFGARTATLPVSAASSGVIAEAMRFVGSGNVTGARGAWCADYASMVLRRTGHRALGSRMVSSAFAYGPRVSQPKPGDLVVLSGRRGYASHVGFFAGYRNGQILMVSGNWGHRVSVAPIPRGSVAAFIGV